MALLSTDVMVGQASRNVKDRPEGQKVSGDIRMIEATYTTTATEVTADVMQVAQIPVGAILLPEKCWVWSEGVGGTAVIYTSMGDALDAARYATGDLALTAASAATLPVVPLAAIILARYVALSTSNIITFTTAGTFPLTAAKKIVHHLEYRMA